MSCVNILAEQSQRGSIAEQPHQGGHCSFVGMKIQLRNGWMLGRAIAALVAALVLVVDVGGYTQDTEFSPSSRLEIDPSSLRVRLSC